MKLISCERSKVVMLFPTEEMKPMTGFIRADLVILIKERYKFLNPDLTGPDAAMVTTFNNGIFTNNDENFPINDLSIFADGLVAGADVTSIAESFLYDFIIWAVKDFGLRAPTSEFKKLYLSNVIIELDKDINGFLSKFDLISRAISENMAKVYGAVPNVYVTRLAFGQDRTKLPNPDSYSDFVLERRAGVSFEINRYFSSAPLPTELHIEMLTSLEAGLA